MTKRYGIGEIGEGSGGRTNSFSRRVLKGNMWVIRRLCEHCGHHKAFKYGSGRIKCTCCGREVYKKKKVKP